MIYYKFLHAEAQVMFMEPGEEFFMKTVEFLNPVQIEPLISSALLKVQPSTFTRLDFDPPCRTYSVQEYKDCLIGITICNFPHPLKCTGNGGGQVRILG